MKLFRKIMKTCFVLLFLGGITFVGIYTYAKITPKLSIKSANAVMMYDDSNTMFFQGTGAKEWVSLDDISIYLIKSTISTEDKNFYGHLGFDYLRIAKAMYTNIMSKSKSQGASTISQQYAKNLFLSFDKTWERKIEETWLTVQIETHYSKNEILEGYLNTINYGHGMYGIENASKFYFNKSAADLTLAEASLLTGVPKSPSNYSPITNFKLAKNRQERILLNMYKNNVITKDECDNALKEVLNILGKKDSTNLNTVMYYQDAVLKELNTISSVPKNYIESGGLRVFTYLNIKSQTDLEESIKNNIGNTDLQISSIMMKPNNGAVFALIGGQDYSKSQFNRATSSKRQVGSTMKPILYYAALENGFTSSTTFLSDETTFTFSNNKTYSPQNYGGTYGKMPISLATAISYSDNIYAVKTHMFLGQEVLVDTSKRLGINSNLEMVPSLALGTGEINILEMASAYGTFANEGYSVKPHLIERVEDLAGNILYQYKEEKKQILNKSSVYILNDLLTTTYDSSMINYNYPTAISISSKLTNKYSLKSGTTDSDHWSIGYNKDALCAVWIGYDDSKSLSIGDYKYSRNIWSDSIENYFKGKETEWYKQPENVVGVLVNPITGKPASKDDKNKRIMYYIKGSEPTGNEPVFDEIASKE